MKIVVLGSMGFDKMGMTFLGDLLNDSHEYGMIGSRLAILKGLVPQTPMSEMAPQIWFLIST